MTRRWRSFAVEAARAGRRYAPPVAIDDHHVLGADLVAHALILAPASPCGRAGDAVHGCSPASRSYAACAAASSAKRPKTAEPEPLTAGGQRPAASSRARRRRSAGRAPRPRPARSFSTSAASCSASARRERLGRERRDALPRARRRPVARVHLGRAERDARPGEHDPGGRSQRARLEQLAAAAREGRSRPEAKNGTSEPTSPASAIRSPAASGSGSVAFASRSAAPASALPPPSPAPTGTCLSMLHAPARRVARARRQQARARA